MLLYDILRSMITNVMLTVLLVTLAQPKCRKRTLWFALTAIVVLDMALNIIFYLRNDYTLLGKLDILFFILIGVVLKPLFHETFMHWLFNCFAVMNVYAIVVILSYYLCGLFPHPYFALIALRFILFATVIVIFHKRLRPLYRQAAEHWSVYLFVLTCLFLNFAWYFMASNDIEQMMTNNFVQLLLLVLLAILVYLAIFLSLRKTMQEAALREENLKIQSDREMTRQRLALMDEAVHQMIIVQHDHRHFSNTLLSLLRQGEANKAVELIRQQSDAMPLKPQSYCQNVSVNAAVSYYTELARQRGINCELRLDIPKELHIDEFSLAMVVSNLMENAITAVFALPAEEDRVVRFTAVNTGQLILELSNPYTGEVLLDERGFPISPEKGHGNGTQSVVDFINKCGGELVYDISGGIFTVRIMV